jgi:hypothetical protein
LWCAAAVELELGLEMGLRPGWEAVRPRWRQCEPASARKRGSSERVKREDKRGVVADESTDCDEQVIS